jgi:hypothetical protein
MDRIFALYSGVHGVAAYDSRARIVPDSDDHGFLLFGFMRNGKMLLTCRTGDGLYHGLAYLKIKQHTKGLDETHQTLSSAVRNKWLHNATRHGRIIF